MPELPDITVYVTGLRQRIVNHTWNRVRIISPFLLRSFDPPVESLEGRRVQDVSRLGKRIVLSLEDDLHVVLHLMIAGRLLWKDATTIASAARPNKIALALIEFDTGLLTITEASQKKRASLHIVHGRDGLREHFAGGLDVLDATADEFIARLRQENHTLKRALTDPRLFSGIGNAYSDEILHAARLSPVTLTSRLNDEHAQRLHTATVETLQHWISELTTKFANRFPGLRDITAFRDGFAVHGRYGKPCPVCGVKVQRIRYAENETNYCPKCQTGGRILADRSLSRLLREDWPRRIEELD